MIAYDVFMIPMSTLLLVSTCLVAFLWLLDFGQSFFNGYFYGEHGILGKTRPATIAHG